MGVFGVGNCSSESVDNGIYPATFGVDVFLTPDKLPQPRNWHDSNFIVNGVVVPPVPKYFAPCNASILLHSNAILAKQRQVLSWYS